MRCFLLPSKFAFVLGITLVCATISSCSSGAIRSSIESYNVLPSSGGGKTISILPANSNLDGSIEFRTNANKLSQKFIAEGYVVVDGRKVKPDYVAFFAYGVDDGQLVTSTYSIPEWGVTGYSGANTYGTVNVYGNSATYNSRTTLTPRYGVTGYSTGVTTNRIYTRALVLDIYDTAKIDFKSKSMSSAQVYAGKLVSSGSCGAITGVLDALLESLFKDFPGPNGGARTVEIPISKPGC
jgi:hypothetical protein